jgi:hypothetical protein
MDLTENKMTVRSGCRNLEIKMDLIKNNRNNIKRRKKIKVSFKNRAYYCFKSDLFFLKNI